MTHSKTHSLFAALAIASILAGCGLAETGAAAAADAEAAAQAAKQAKEMEAKVQQRVDAANQTAAEQRDAAEKMTE